MLRIRSIFIINLLFLVGCSGGGAGSSLPNAITPTPTGSILASTPTPVATSLPQGNATVAPASPAVSPTATATPTFAPVTSDFSSIGIGRRPCPKPLSTLLICDYPYGQEIPEAYFIASQNNNSGPFTVSGFDSSVVTISSCSVSPPQLGSCTSPNEFGVTSVGVGSTVATITGSGGSTLHLPITVTAIDLHVSIIPCCGPSTIGQFNGPLSASLTYVDTTGKTVTIQGLGPKNLLPQASYGDFVYYNAFPLNQISALPLNVTITLSLQGVGLTTYSTSTSVTIQPGQLNIVQASLTY